MVLSILNSAIKIRQYAAATHMDLGDKIKALALTPATAGILHLCALDLAHDDQDNDSATYKQVNEAVLPPQTSTQGNWLAIKPSPGKGLGLFALRDVPYATMVLCEAPLIRMNDKFDAVQLEMEVAALTSSQQAAFSTIARYKRTPEETENEAIVHTNSFRTGKDTGAMFATGCRFNHSCSPNTTYMWDERAERMIFITRWNIREGEELTINYGTVHQGNLKQYWGFDCDCGSCEEGFDHTGSQAPSRRKKFVLFMIVPVFWAMFLFYILAYRQW